jgi:ferredoxin-NADP reductase/MOSC domain-containing protein YiiM
MGLVVSVNVGLPCTVDWRGTKVSTAIGKKPLVGRVFAGRLNLAGDRQADLIGHGGEHRAVMVYQTESYGYWEANAGLSALPYGSFGENLTVDGLADLNVCIGDRYRIGSAVFEVTQPRVTCYKLGLHFARPELPALLVKHQRPGFYFRVIKEGEVGTGDVIEKIASGPERMTVAEIDALLYTAGHPVEALERSLRIPALSAGWVSSLRALLQASSSGETGNAGLAPDSGPKPLWQGFRTVSVEAITRESEDVRSLTLAADDGSALPAAQAGQHIVVRVKIGEDHVSRSYSVIDSPDGRYEIAVKREANGKFSNYVHSDLKAGDSLQISAPRGAFLVADGTRPIVLVSAGIGVTPLLSMLKHVLSGSKRELLWFHVARNRRHHPFAARVRALMADLGQAKACIAYTQPEPDLRLGIDYDVAGRLDLDVLRRWGATQRSDFYLCGPGGFMAGMNEGLTAWGVDRSCIYSELFGAGAAPINDHAFVRPHAPEIRGDGPAVTFTRSALTVRWDRSYTSLLELAEACSVPVRWSCRTGVCHSCESGLVDGEVDYRPEPIDRPGSDRVLVCCARPVTDISVDL